MEEESKTFEGKLNGIQERLSKKYAEIGQTPNDDVEAMIDKLSAFCSFSVDLMEAIADELIEQRKIIKENLVSMETKENN